MSEDPKQPESSEPAGELKVDTRFSIDADTRDALRLYGVVAALHIAAAVGLQFVRSVTPEVSIEMEASEGVALLARIGYVAEGTDEIIDEIDPNVVVEPQPAEPEAPDDVPETEPKPEPEPTVEPEPEPEPEAEPEPEPEPEPVPEPDSDPEPVPEPKPEPEPEREAEPEQGDEEPEPDEATVADNDDPASLPPAQRYPEGTLNPIGTDVGMWGPEGARLVAILRMDRLRTSANADELRTMLEGLPDWQTVIGGADIDPFADMDALLIASSDPRFVNRTFIAAVHHREPTDIMHRLGSGYPGGLRWADESGWAVGRSANPQLCPLRDDPERPCDPRVFVVPTSTLFILARPEVLDALRTGAPEPEQMDLALEYARDPQAVLAQVEARREAERRAIEEAMRQQQADAGEAQDAGTGGGSPIRNRRRRPSPPPAPAPTPEPAPAPAPGPAPADEPVVFDPNYVPSRYRVDDAPPVRQDGWIGGLLEIGDFGDDVPGGPVAMVTANGFSRFMLEGMGDAAPPTAIHANIFDESDPRITARFVFAEPADAERFAEVWPAVVDAQPLLRLIGLRGPLLEAVWQIDHNEATATVVIPASTFSAMAMTIGALNAARLGN